MSAPVTHWARGTAAACGRAVVWRIEADLSRVTCVRCLEEACAETLKAFAERELEPMAKKNPDKSDVKVEKFTRNLRVVLKENEVVERAKRSAFLLGEIQQKESERDAAKKQASAHIEELASEMHRLSLEVRDGAAYRDVECERMYVYKVGIVEERRTDTNDVIHERAMTEREKQLELELKAPNGKKDAAAEAKTLSDAVVKSEAAQKIANAGGELKTEKKRKPRKPKAAEQPSA